MDTRAIRTNKWPLLRVTHEPTCREPLQYYSNSVDTSVTSNLLITPDLLRRK
jgi:hypothetical protein